MAKLKMKIVHTKNRAYLYLLFRYIRYKKNACKM